MKIDQKLKVGPPDGILKQKGREVFKMTKNLNFERNFAISGSFDEKHQKWAKSDLKLAKHS